VFFAADKVTAIAALSPWSTDAALPRQRMWVDGSEFRWSKDGAAVPAVA
jgi:hypothetical protein